MPIKKLLLHYFAKWWTCTYQQSQQYQTQASCSIPQEC